MTEYLHGGHSKCDIKYHVVWITKYRYKVITPEIGKRLKELLIQGCACRSILSFPIFSTRNSVGAMKA